jgi:hypothetical protein
LQHLAYENYVRAQARGKVAIWDILKPYYQERYRYSLSVPHGLLVGIVMRFLGTSWATSHRLFQIRVTHGVILKASKKRKLFTKALLLEEL